MNVERLDSKHELANFHCGVKRLDDWLKSYALENQRRDLSRTFVLVEDTGSVVGYYSLTMGGVRRQQLPPRFGRGLPDVEIGMVLLGRLAVDTRRRGEGLGRDLLVDAVLQAVAAGEHAAARFLAVDPIDEAARGFYKHFGFRDVPGDEHDRMFMRLDEVRASLEEAEKP
jgi:GNAT superfamily N-acetyltransferase